MMRAALLSLLLITSASSLWRRFSRAPAGEREPNRRDRKDMVSSLAVERGVR